MKRNYERKYPDEYIVDTIVRFSERVNGFPCTWENRLHWGLMNKSTQMKILEKWYDLWIELGTHLDSESN